MLAPAFGLQRSADAQSSVRYRNRRFVASEPFIAAPTEATPRWLSAGPPGLVQLS